MEKQPISKSLRTVVVFTVVSIAMSLIKIPGPAGSAALDSASGFFAAMYFSPLVGAVVGLLGHFGTAATSGFPFGGLHIYVAIQMFVWCWLLGKIVRVKRNVFYLILGCIVMVVLNGIIAPIMLIYTPVFKIPEQLGYSLMPVLGVSTAINIAIAGFAYYLIAKTSIVNL